MKMTLGMLWLTSLALTAAAQDFPMPAATPPPMRVPMPSLAPTAVPVTTPIPATTPMASAGAAVPATSGNHPKSPALPPLPPPSLPGAVIAQTIPCYVDMAYRVKNADCAVNVLRSLLTTSDPGRVAEADLEGAQARAVSYGARQSLSNADQDVRDGVSLMQSGNWSEAHGKLTEAYGEIEHLAEISDDEKESVRSLLEYSEAAEKLSHNDNAGAKAGFLQSYEDAQDPNAEAAALFSEAEVEIGTQHPERALQLLPQAYGQAGRNLKSSILLARVGVLLSKNDNAVADGAARQAIEDAESGQQKAFATLAYAAWVHTSDPTRAKRILGDAEALCNSDAEWARNQRLAIEHFKETWGG